MSLGWKWVDGTTLTDKEMSMESLGMLRYEQHNIQFSETVTIKPSTCFVLSRANFWGTFIFIRKERQWQNRRQPCDAFHPIT